MKKLFTIWFLLCLTLKLNATHIVGGEIMYKFLNKNNNTINYRITLFLYIDCDNGTSGAIASDVEGFFNVFEVKTGNQFTRYQSYQLTNARTGPQTVAINNYKCIKNAPNLCVDKYTYTMDISVPENSLGYVVTFERCCRNNTITNIITPESTGATYWTKIPGYNLFQVDNSPVFKSLPANFLCTNAPLNFDHSATDADGDSLVYELYTPYAGATNSKPLPTQFEVTNPRDLKQILWGSGYSVVNQIDGLPTLSINRKTGKLTLTPTVTGQFVVGIRVLQYRKGILIGETKRDYQFNVSECDFDVVSSFFIPFDNCTDNEITFQNRSQGANEFLWDFDYDNNPGVETSTLKSPKYTYKKAGTYKVRLVSKAEICVDTSEYEINVKQNFVTKLPNDTLICGAFTKPLFTNQPNKTYLWSTGAKTPTINVSSGGKYWVKVFDNPCVSSDTIEIINDLSKLDLGPDSVICRDSFVQFTYNGKPGYKSYLWNDNTTKQEVFISALGKYWVNVINQNNCPSDDSITFVLYPPPRVNLNDTLFCRNTTVTLDGVNYSIKTKLETNYTWNTGETTPQIVTGTPGTYTVKVRNRLCTIFDTAVIDFIQTGLELGNDTFFCGPVYRILKPLQNYVSYIWHDFAEVKTYVATTPGKKKLTITTIEGCIESDSVYITQYPEIDGGLGNDTTICLSTRLELKASDSMESYLWNTGANTRSIFISDSGKYSVTVRNKNGCIISDSIRIKEQSDALPIQMYMPNAFTPNNDEVNDLYPSNKYKDPGTDYLFRVYNRWGEKVFESKSPTIQWDGNFKSEMAPQDVYIYYVKYTGCDEVERWFRGTFTLMR